MFSVRQAVLIFQRYFAVSSLMWDCDLTLLPVRRLILVYIFDFGVSIIYWFVNLARNFTKAASNAISVSDFVN